MLFSPPHQALQIKQTGKIKRTNYSSPRGTQALKIRFEMTPIPLKLSAAVKLRRRGG